MKLMNRDTYLEGVNKIVAEVNKVEKEKDSKSPYPVMVKVDTAKEDKDGVLAVILTLKAGTDTTKKVAIYIIESYHRLETIVINNRTCKVLFQNNTMNSPQISLNYLNGILLNEIEFCKKLKTYHKKKPAGKKPFNKGAKSGGFQKKPGTYQKKPYGSQQNGNRSYQKKQGSGGYKPSYNKNTKPCSSYGSTVIRTKNEQSYK